MWDRAEVCKFLKLSNNDSMTYNTRNISFAFLYFLPVCFPFFNDAMVDILNLLVMVELYEVNCVGPTSFVRIVCIHILLVGGVD